MSSSIWRCSAALWLAGIVLIQTAEQLPPAVFIPGLVGSILDADVHRKSAVNPLCSLEGKDNVWFNTKYLVPGLMDCWVEEMSLKLDVDASKREGREVDIEPEGVHVHARSNGDDFENVFFNYGVWHGGVGIWTLLFHQLQLLGYDAKRDMHAAPFDWRRGPAHWKFHDWPRLKQYIEDVVARSGRRAILFSMSQGSPYAAGFLIHFVDSAWKSKHIEGFVSYSGVFGGTPAALALALWGNVQARQERHDLGYEVKVDYLGDKNVKALLPGFGGIYALMPMQIAWDDELLMQLPPAFLGNVTIKDLTAVLHHVSPQMGQHYELIQEFPLIEHPGVKTYCFYGKGLPSPAYYTYLTKPINESTSESANAGVIADDFLNAAKAVGNGEKPDVMNLMKGVNDLSHSLSEGWSGAQKKSPTPTAVPANSKPGSSGWAKSVGELIANRRPDTLQTKLGDGLVPEAGLAVCRNWRGQEGMPDVQVHTISKGTHGSELFNAEALLATRAIVATLAKVTNPSDKSIPEVEKPNGQTDMAQPLVQFAAFIPPMVATWTCPQWVHGIDSMGIPFSAKRCSADACLSSPLCDSKLKDALKKDHAFVRRRCPETCHVSNISAAGPVAAPIIDARHAHVHHFRSAGSYDVKPATAHAQSQLHRNTGNDPMRNNESHSVLFGFHLPVILVLAMLIAFFSGICFIVVLCLCLGGSRKVTLESDVPLREDGDFSDFEDFAGRRSFGSRFRNLIFWQRPARQPSVSESSFQIRHPSADIPFE